MIVLFIVSLGFLVMMTVNYIIWWGSLIIITMVGIIKLKFYGNPPYASTVYFFVQEVCGALFIVSLSTTLQLVMVLIKGGFSPVHGWLLTVVSMSKGRAFLWIITWQKVPYLYLAIHFLSWGSVAVIMVSIVLPLIQGMFTARFKGVFFYLMTASGSSLIVYSYYSPFMMCVVRLFYAHMMSGVSGMVGARGNLYLGLESVFLLMSQPGSMPFYFKLAAMRLVGEGGGLLLVLVLIIIVLNLTLIINVIMNFNYKFSPGNKHFLFLMVRYMVVPYL